MFTLVWFVVFGWSAMRIDGIGGDGGTISAAVAESIPLAMFEFFENFPAATLVQGIAVVVVALFFATSSDSASLVIDMLCSGDGEAGPVRQRVFWGLTEGAVAATLIVLGGDEGLNALQEVITVIGLPIFVLVSLMIVTLIMGLRAEKVKVKPVTQEEFLNHRGKTTQTQSEEVRESSMARDTDATAPAGKGTADDTE